MNEQTRNSIFQLLADQIYCSFPKSVNGCMPSHLIIPQGCLLYMCCNILLYMGTCKLLDVTNQAVLDTMSKHHMLSDVTITGIQDIVIVRGWLTNLPRLSTCSNVERTWTLYRSPWADHCCMNRKWHCAFKGILNNK